MCEKLAKMLGSCNFQQLTTLISRENWIVFEQKFDFSNSVITYKKCILIKSESENESRFTNSGIWMHLLCCSRFFVSSRACLRHSLSWQVASSTRKFIQKLFSERSPPKQEGSARAISDHSQQANSLVHRCFWTRKRDDFLIFKKVRVF